MSDQRKLGSMKESAKKDLQLVKAGQMSPHELRLLLHKNTERKVSLYEIAPRIVKNTFWLNDLGFWFGKWVCVLRAVKKYGETYPAPTEMANGELMFAHAARQARTMGLKPFAVGWWQAHYLFGKVEFESLGWSPEMIQRRWAAALVEEIRARMSQERKAELDEGEDDGL